MIRSRMRIHPLGSLAAETVCRSRATISRIARCAAPSTLVAVKSLFEKTIVLQTKWTIVALLLSLLPARAADVPAVDFNRDVRPVLSDHCYACHGPDANKRKAGLRLDQQEFAFRELKSGEHAIVPGSPDQSALVWRVTNTDPDELMPPEESHREYHRPPQLLLN